MENCQGLGSSLCYYAQHSATLITQTLALNSTYHAKTESIIDKSTAITFGVIVRTAIHVTIVHIPQSYRKVSVDVVIVHVIEKLHQIWISSKQSPCPIFRAQYSKVISHNGCWQKANGHYFPNELLYTLVVSVGPGQTKLFDMPPKRLVKVKIASIYSSVW